MDVITSTELASYLREANPDTAALDLLVELSNGIVSEVTGDLTPIPTRVKAITLEVAARAYRNPDGYATESIDDWRGGRPAETAAAGVYLTESETATLNRLAGVVTSRSAYTIGVVSPLDVS